MNETPALNIAGILGHLPHRYPFLLVDRVLTIKPGETLTAVKNVSFNEPFFPGHFPGQPIMPGVLILEALAQATGILAFESYPNKTLGMYYLVGVDKTRFKRPVVPGDQLLLQVHLLRYRRDIGVFDCAAKVADQLAVSAELMCARREMSA